MLNPCVSSALYISLSMYAQSLRASAQRTQLPPPHWGRRGQGRRGRRIGHFAPPLPTMCGKEPRSRQSPLHARHVLRPDPLQHGHHAGHSPCGSMATSGRFVRPRPKHTSHTCRPRPLHVLHRRDGSTIAFGRSRRSDPTSRARLSSSLCTTRRRRRCPGPAPTQRPSASSGENHPTAARRLTAGGRRGREKGGAATGAARIPPRF